MLNRDWSFDALWPPAGQHQRSLLWIATLALLVECVFYATVPAASSYETSPITPYPAIHWVLFATVIATVVVVFVGDAEHRTGYWPYALALLLCNYALFVFLPAFRGYALYGRGSSDSLYHLGYIKGISESGGFPTISGEMTWYPMLHSISAQLQLLGWPLPAVKYLVSFLTIVLLVLGSGAALYALFGSRAAFLLGLAAATPLVFATKQVGFQPQFVSTALLPVIIAAVEGYRRTASTNYLAVLLIVLGSIIYFHPVTLTYLFAFLIISVSFWRVYSRWHRTSTHQLRYWLALTLVPVAFVWYIDHGKTAGKLTTVIVSLQGTLPSPAAEEATQTTEAALTAVQVAFRFLQLYGAIAIYLLMGGVVGLVVCHRFVHRRAAGNEAYLTVHAGFGLLTSTLLLLVNPVQGGPIRIARYLLVFAILLVGVGLVWSLELESPQSAAASVVLVLAIVIAGCLGAGAVYIPNNHMTHAEYEGTEFVLQHHDGETPVRAHAVSYKMEMYVEGADSETLRPYRLGSSRSQVYPRLGYDGNETAAETYGESYLTTKAYDRRQHTATYYFPRQQRARFMYNQTHMRLLSDDTTAQKYLDNGGFEVWRIRNATAGDR